MSEDLIERLREGRTTGTDLRWTVTPEHLEAATEIERLRAKLAKFDRLSGGLIDEVQFMRNAARENRERAEAAEKRLASAKEVIAPFGSHALDWSEYDDSESLIEAWAEGPDELPSEPLPKWKWFQSLTIGHLRAAAEWMEKGDE